MIFNGHTEQYINSLDEDLFAEIQVMYADGMLGNKAIYDSIAPLTAVVFNYMRSKNSPAYKPDQIFPWINEYSIDPDEDINSVNDSLLTFLSQAPNFSMERFKNGD
ncbi:hypothetical protein EB001_08040 [bacterium]|nr:hypothetical protein [bacterium]